MLLQMQEEDASGVGGGAGSQKRSTEANGEIGADYFVLSKKSKVSSPFSPLSPMLGF